MMKRIILSFFLCLSFLTAQVSLASAQVPSPETPGNVISIVISAIRIAGILKNAFSSVSGSEIDFPAPPAAPTAVPARPTAMPTYVPTAVPTATPVPTAIPTEAPAKSAPADPESVSDSTGIGVNDFYNALKANIKQGGRHSVSIEEKGRKGASKIIVDDDIEIYLYNSKSVISRFNFEALFSEGTEDGIRTIFSDLLNTIGQYLKIRFSEADSAKIYETVRQGGSMVYGNLLLYGSTGEKKGKIELIVKIYYTGEAYVEPETTSYSQDAENDFRDLIDDLKAEGVVPYSSGSFHFHEDYQGEWAQINWYQWNSFDTAQNFVIASDIEWKSASDTPNFEYAGCGFVFRSLDTNNNLYASINMDGKVHFGGFRGGSSLNYSSYSYGSHSTRGSAQFILVVNGDKATVYVDGSRIGTLQGLALTNSGNLAFNVLSGTNKDYGTRCIFRNVYYYTW